MLPLKPYCSIKVDPGQPWLYHLVKHSVSSLCLFLIRIPKSGGKDNSDFSHPSAESDSTDVFLAWAKCFTKQ